MGVNPSCPNGKEAGDWLRWEKVTGLRENKSGGVVATPFTPNVCRSEVIWANVNAFEYFWRSTGCPSALDDGAVVRRIFTRRVCAKEDRRRQVSFVICTEKPNEAKISVDSNQRLASMAHAFPCPSRLLSNKFTSNGLEKFSSF